MVGIILLTTTRIKKNGTSKSKQTDEQLMPHQIPEIVDDISSIHHHSDREFEGHHGKSSGVRNLGFEDIDQNIVSEKDRDRRLKQPVPHFPPPPRPSSSSNSTSDSSNYYNEGQNSDQRNERNYNIFKKHKENMLLTRKQQLEKQQHLGTDDLYSVVKDKDKKRIAKQQKQKGHHRRKYMSENRVGFIEKNDPQQSGDSDIFEVSDHNPYYEHNEAFNPNVKAPSSQYNTNKLLLDSTFIVNRNTNLDLDSSSGDREHDNDHDEPDPGTARSHIHRLKNKNPSSADTQSIGSFLSMVSVKSFPRCSVPEPLSRVLEPVSVTHLDQYEKITTRSRHNDENINELHLNRSQSDGADPGVIGPVVWEMHKQGKRL